MNRVRGSSARECSQGAVQIKWRSSSVIEVEGVVKVEGRSRSLPYFSIERLTVCQMSRSVPAQRVLTLLYIHEEVRVG